MAQVTDAQLNALFNLILNELADQGNTKDRVYNALKNTYDTLNATKVSIDGGTINGTVKIAGVLEVNSDDTPAPSIYLFSFPLHMNNRTITAIGHNVKPHPTIADSFLLETNGIANGGMITAYCNNYASEYKAFVPSVVPHDQDQVITIAQLEAIMVEVPIPTA